MFEGAMFFRLENVMVSIQRVIINLLEGFILSQAVISF